MKSGEYGRVKNTAAQIYELKEAIRLNPQDGYYVFPSVQEAQKRLTANP